MDQFAALAVPARRRIVDILASGEHTSGQIADVLGYEFRISRTAVSKHLRVLRDAHLVDVRAEERWRWYRLDKAGFEGLRAEVDELHSKTLMAIGWDADARREYDPLPVPFKGPGRPRRHRRGTQSAPTISRDPDDGLYPVRPVPELPQMPRLDA